MQVQAEDLGEKDKKNYMGSHGDGGKTPSRHHQAPFFLKLPEDRERRGGTKDKEGTLEGEN